MTNTTELISCCQWDQEHDRKFSTFLWNLLVHLNLDVHARNYWFCHKGRVFPQGLGRNQAQRVEGAIKSICGEFASHFVLAGKTLLAFVKL